MRNIITLLIFISLVSSTTYAQKELISDSKINSVTVYKNGAQIYRTAKVKIPVGKSLIVLSGLSPFIKDESVRVQGNGTITILNVQFEENYVEGLTINLKADSLSKQIGKLSLQLEEEEVKASVIKERIGFIHNNDKIVGPNQTVTPESYDKFSQIYGNKLQQLNQELLIQERLLKDIRTEKFKYENQLNTIISETVLPSGNILVTIQSKTAQTTPLNFNYIVENARWFPSYDMRFENFQKPIAVTHKANIQQNTGVDWEDVHLTLSTAKTDVSAQIPSMFTYFLDYHTPDYHFYNDSNMSMSKALQSRAAGVQVQSDSGAPGAGTQVQVRGMTSLNGSQPLFVVDGVPVGYSVDNLDQNSIQSIDILKESSSTALYGARGAAGVVVITTKPDYISKSSVPLMSIKQNETSNEYQIKEKQSVKSEKKDNTIVYMEVELPAIYEYQSLPKLSEHVFLIARVPNWYKAGLNDGEVNVYMENTFAGKSVINTNHFSDTLPLSFGVDNTISIKREMLNEFSKSQLIGLNKKDLVVFKTTVRNNKSTPIYVDLTDQFPISKRKEIQVEILETSQGDLNEGTGIIKWKLELGANESKDIIIKYSAKYPKNERVILK